MPSCNKVVIALSIALLVVAGCSGTAANSDSPDTNPTPPPSAEKEAAAGAQIEQKLESQQPFVVDQVIVKFSDALAADEVQALVDYHGLTLEKALGISGLYLLTIPDGRSVNEVIETLEADDRIAYAEPNYILKTNQ